MCTSFAWAKNGLLVVTGRYIWITEWVIRCVPLELNHELSMSNICDPSTLTILSVRANIWLDVKTKVVLLGAVYGCGQVNKFKASCKWCSSFDLQHPIIIGKW
jgi:hypothetical protein